MNKKLKLEKFCESLREKGETEFSEFVRRKKVSLKIFSSLI